MPVLSLSLAAMGAGAREEVIESAARVKAPVGYALRGKQWLEHDNPYAVGLTGLLGYGGAYGAINHADLSVDARDRFSIFGIPLRARR